jgi:hypothetical protein
MPTITNDPIRAEILEGLKDPRPLLAAVNRLQQEAATILNGGATLANAWRVMFPAVEVVVPDDWVPLTPINGFADIGPANGAGAFAVRKWPDGRVEVREAVNRGAGAPAAFTVIADLPAGFGPNTSLRRVSDAAGVHGVYDVIAATGSAPAKLRWVAGTPTVSFWLSGGQWAAADKSLPAWDKPVSLRLTDKRVSASTGVREVLCVGRTQDGSAALLSRVTVTGAYVQPPARPGEPFLLVLPRMDGLVPGIRYTLTLWAFLE